MSNQPLCPLRPGCGPDMTETGPIPPELTRWLEWLGTSDCRCTYAWRSLGTLCRISMGKGWVRMSTDLACRHHGERP